MKRYKIKIEYDGVPFVGWQKQENGLSIQGCLEQAINNIFEDVTIYGAVELTLVFTPWVRLLILIL